MGASLLMSIGTRAMNASYAQLMTASNNIANANTPGYSRQQVQLTPSEGQFTGSGYFGRGVTVQTVKRATDVFRSQQSAAAASQAAADSKRSDLMGQLEKVYGTGAKGLGAAATDIFGAWSDLAATPSDLSSRQSVLARIQSFSTLANTDADQLAALQASVVQDVRNSVTDVNQMLQDVAGLNRRIIDSTGNGQAPNDLLDQRDALVAKIGQAMEVTTIGAPDGSVGVFAVSGQNLVLGAQANALVATTDSRDPTRAAVALKVGTAVTPLQSDKLGGGSIAGALRFQDEDLTDARNRLGQLVASVAGMLNRQQSFGLDLSGQSGAAVLQIDPPAARPAASNATAGGAFVAQVSVSVSDPSALQASEYLLETDPANAGKYQLTRLADGSVTGNLASGASVDGFTFNVDVPLAAGDKFLLQPVGNAAATIRPALGDPRGLAAASPVTVAAAVANTGSGSVGALAITAAPTQPYQALNLAFTDNAGGWQLTDASASVLASGTLAAGVPLTYNGMSLRIDGAPKTGDRFTISPTQYPAADNGNATATDALASLAFVAGSTVGDAYAQAIAEIGSRSAGASAAAESSAAVAVAAKQSLSSATGVNLDEEAAQLMQYQQSYQAAAKVLQTAQSVLQTLLQLGVAG